MSRFVCEVCGLSEEVKLVREFTAMEIGLEPSEARPES